MSVSRISRRTRVAARRFLLRRPWVLLAVIVVVWQIVSRDYPAYMLPSPLQVAAAFWQGILEQEVLFHAGISAVRAIGSWLFGSAVGIAAGFAMAYSPVVAAQLGYVLRVIQPIPGIAWIGVVLIWFGIGNTSLVVVTLLTVIPIAATATFEGFRSIDREYIKAARTLGVRTNWSLFRYVSLPAALPAVLTGLNLALAFGWRTLAGAEIVASASGLGYWMDLNRVALRTANVFVVLVFYGAMMVLFEILVYRPLERKVLGGWSRGEAS
jgi:NitT/TauT family transport system permease protein